MEATPAMRSRYGVLAVLACLLFSAAHAFAGTVPPGYEKLRWDTKLATVATRYPHGITARLGDEVVYRQQRPDKTIFRRNFAFREGKLHTVVVTFEKRYVEKKGIEHILRELEKQLGEGSMDRSRAPDMITTIWEGNGSRITFSYAPRRPDMTVIMYERK